MLGTAFGDEVCYQLSLDDLFAAPFGPAGIEVQLTDCFVCSPSSAENLINSDIRHVGYHLSVLTFGFYPCLAV